MGPDKTKLWALRDHVHLCARLCKKLDPSLPWHGKQPLPCAKLVGVTSYDEERVWDRGVFGESAVLLRNHQWDKSQRRAHFAVSSPHQQDKSPCWIPSASFLGHGERRDWSLWWSFVAEGKALDPENFLVANFLGHHRTNYGARVRVSVPKGSCDCQTQFQVKFPTRMRDSRSCRTTDTCSSRHGELASVCRMHSLSRYSETVSAAAMHPRHTAIRSLCASTKAEPNTGSNITFGHLCCTLQCMSDSRRTDAVFASCQLAWHLRIRLAHNSQSSPPPTKKCVLPCRGIRQLNPRATARAYCAVMGTGRGIPLLCSSPSCAVEAHNFSRLGSGEVGPRSALATRTVPAGAPGPGDLRPGRDRDHALDAYAKDVFLFDIANHRHYGEAKQV